MEARLSYASHFDLVPNNQTVADLALHNASNDAYWTMATCLTMWAMITGVGMSTAAPYPSYDDAVFISWDAEYVETMDRMTEIGLTILDT